MKLLLVSLACLVAAAIVPSALVQSPRAAAITNFQGRGVDRFTQKTLHGPEVVARIKKLRAKNKGVARAMRDLERKGLRPALDQSVTLLQIRKPAVSRDGTNPFLKASFQSETFSEDGYEMTFVSYDDGDPNTWEGVIYEHDPEGREYSYTASFDISGEQETWDRIEETYYPWDGSQPVSSSQPEYYDPSHPTHDPMMEQPVSKANSPRRGTPSFVKTSFNPTTQWRVYPPHWSDRGRRWLKCSAGGCLGSAVSCLWSGPLWPGCFASRCAGAGAACIILTW